jgi:hypothetical protein
MGGLKPWLDHDSPDNIAEEPDELVGQEDTAYEDNNSEETSEVID